MTVIARRCLIIAAGLILGGASGWACKQVRTKAALAPVTISRSVGWLENKPSPEVQSAAPDAAACEQAFRRAFDQGRLGEAKEWAVKLAQWDGVRAVRLALQTFGKKSDYWLEEVLRVAAAQNPDDVVKLLRETPQLHNHPPFVRQMFAGLAQHSVPKALEVWQGAGDLWPMTALEAIGHEWGRQNWREAAGYGLQMADQTKRKTFLAEVMGDRLKQNFPEVADWLSSLLPTARERLDLQWASVEPTTLNELATLAALVPRTHYLATKNDAWCEKLAKLVDATSATRAWVDALPPGHLREQAWQAYVLRAVESSPESLPALLRDTPDAEGRARLTSTLAGMHACRDIHGALAYAESLPDPRARQMARRTVLGVMAQGDTAGALDLILRTEETWQPDDHAALSVISGFLKPEAACALAAQLRDPGLQEKWLNNALVHWLKLDPAAAAVWVNQLPKGKLRDTAVSRIALHVGEKDPSTAMNWASLVTDPRSRQNSQLDIALAWQRLDRAGYQAWLAQANLDVETYTRLAGIAQKAQPTTSWSTHSDQGKGTVIFEP